MLKRVRIQGFKSLADVEVRLQPLVVLFGPNAAGKSNFLDALQLLSRLAGDVMGLRQAFAPPYRGSALEAYSFDGEGLEGLRRRESLLLSLEVDVLLSQAVVDRIEAQVAALEAAQAGTPQEDGIHGPRRRR